MISETKTVIVLEIAHVACRLPFFSWCMAHINNQCTLVFFIPLRSQNPSQHIPSISWKQIKVGLFAILDQKHELREIGFHLDHFCFTNTQFMQGWVDTVTSIRKHPLTVRAWAQVGWACLTPAPFPACLCYHSLVPTHFAFVSSFSPWLCCLGF